MHFIADNTVGRLRRWMSLLGYDIIYDPRSAREILAQPTAPGAGETILIGRCPGLVGSKTGISDGHNGAFRFFHIAQADLPGQMAEVVRAFPLDFARTAFSRCSHCNTLLTESLPLEEIAGADDPDHGIPPLVRKWRRLFRECPACQRVYWEGTHTARVRRCLREWTGVVLPEPLEEPNNVHSDQ